MHRSSKIQQLIFGSTARARNLGIAEKLIASEDATAILIRKPGAKCSPHIRYCLYRLKIWFNNFLGHLPFLHASILYT